MRPLLERYDVELAFHLVSPEPGPNLPEPKLLLELSRTDSAKVAPHYGLRFPCDANSADVSLVELASRILAAASIKEIPELAVAAGDALWACDANAMNALAATHGAAANKDAATRTESGNARTGQAGSLLGRHVLLWRRVVLGRRPILSS